MAFRQVSGNTQYLSPGKMVINQTVEGWYTETSIDDKYGNKKYRIESPEGVIVINGCGKLDHLMSQIEPKIQVKITYLGKKIIEKGARAGTEAHDFNLEVDDDSAMPVMAKVPRVENQDVVPF